MGISYKGFRIRMAEHNHKLTNVRELTGIGWNTLTKLNNDEYVTIRVLEILCQLYSCDFGDLVEYIPDSGA